MQNIEKERYSWLKLGGILLFILLLVLPNAFAENATLNLDDKDMIQLLKIGQALSVILLFIIPSLLFARYLTQSRIHYLGITKPPAFNTSLIAALGMIMALPLINALAELNQQIHLPAALHGLEQWMKDSEEKNKLITEAFMQGTDTSTLLVNLFVIAFMAGLSEELFFRGMLQKVLIECFKNKHVAVWVGAIIFSAFHLQFYGFIPRVLMGAYLGYLFVWSGSLWPSIIAHTMNNGLAVFAAWLVNKGTIKDDIETVGTHNAQELIYVFISAGMVVFSLILIYRIEKRKHTEVPIP
ncbi:MAG TPA: CPBP family intramembrane metalloprotease [Bacteroidia bacterium]|jgi:hypothetical protein|nr:CPBP family intramembrane metalloprotease [Bacteroidia bacterium]HRG53001.1 CPBP family intramembrane metalloprotease [Bacteroidia bacterium]